MTDEDILYWNKSDLDASGTDSGHEEALAHNLVCKKMGLIKLEYKGVGNV